MQEILPLEQVSQDPGSASSGVLFYMEESMGKTAILVDGGFYRKRVSKEWLTHTPEESAMALVKYCHRHLSEHSGTHELYRIFYYDCPPICKQVFDPLTGKSLDLGKQDTYKRMNEFLTSLKEKRKVALRLGNLDIENTVITFSYDTVKRICNGTLDKSGLDKNCMQLSVKQKGVDMKIGIDIASLAYKKQVNQIVLIAGDSDFVPAAKLARREGIDFVLDPLGMNLSHDNALFEHIDGLRTCGNPYWSENKDRKNK